MLTIICGVIGSGKTTFARNNFRYYTDLDDLPPGSQKSHQINLTKALLERHDNVAHITCFPTREEYLSLKDLNPGYVWINTTLEQAKTNILIRSRPRDMANLQNVFKRNAELLNQAKRSTIRFQIVNLF